MPKSLSLLFCALVVVTGCTSTPPPAWKKKPPAPPRKPPMTNVVEMPVVVLHTNPPPAPVIVQAPPPAPHTNEFPESWVSVNRWAQLRNLAPARKLSLKDCVAFTLQTGNGPLVLQSDTMIAYWDDTQLHLGFPPQLIGGQLFVHRLDILKNLEPLLHPPVIDRKSRTIVIDPGHGGINAGTQSTADGQSEKLFTIDLAQRLAPLLAANGWQVFLTRTDDTDVSLADRVMFAETHHADLFISLHFNSAAPDQREAGLETYCLTPTGMTSALTRGYPDDVTDVYPNNAYDAASWAWAFQVHRALMRTNLLIDRGVRRARFMGVLRGQNRPAILIEGGYLSNPAEARRIADPAFRQKLAETIAGALK